MAGVQAAESPQEVVTGSGGSKLLEEALSLGNAYGVAVDWEVRIKFVLGALTVSKAKPAEVRKHASHQNVLHVTMRHFCFAKRCTVLTKSLPRSASWSSPKQNSFFLKLQRSRMRTKLLEDSSTPCRLKCGRGCLLHHHLSLPFLWQYSTKPTRSSLQENAPLHWLSSYPASPRPATSSTRRALPSRVSTLDRSSPLCSDL